MRRRAEADRGAAAGVPTRGRQGAPPERAAVKRERRRQRGFTLLEVMIALAILGAGLISLLSISAADVRAAHKAKLLTIATGLARGKMLDLEEELFRNGFQDTDQNEDGKFDDEGQPKFTWEALIEKVQLPAAGDVANAAGGQPGTPKAALDPNAAGNQEALLGLAGGSSSGALGASMVQLYFPLIAPVLEGAIRKVTLTVHWKIGAEDESLKVICFFTDTKAIDLALHQVPGAATPAAPATTSGGGTKK
jgi:general secretion pathway protein I